MHYVRIFLDEGAPLATLLALVARDQTPTGDYAAALLAAFPAEQIRTDAGRSSDTPSGSTPAGPPLLGEPLTEREHEILRLIAAGYSNQAIADQLVVAVSTVKKHINNLYGKLEVQTRTQALVRARALELLQ